MSEWRRRCEREATIEATTGYGYVYGVCTMVVTELYFRVRYFTGTEASERETCRVQVYNQYKEYFSTDMCGCLAK